MASRTTSSAALARELFTMMVLLTTTPSCGATHEAPTGAMPAAVTTPPVPASPAPHPVPTGPAFIPAASNDLVFGGIQATRYEHANDPQRGWYVQYDVFLLQPAQPGSIPPVPTTMRIHWDRGVPVVNHPYKINAGEVFVDGLFSRDGLRKVVAGSVTYTAVGTRPGELLALDVDLTLDDRRVLRATVAAKLTIEATSQPPP